MTMQNNPARNTRVEFHILQSFPVTCLNRDDVGAPKSAIVGGVSRARVSSQCWKRQVRLAMQDLGVVIASRTKMIAQMVEIACNALGATPEQAKACGAKVEGAFKGADKKPAKKKGKDSDEDTAAEDSAGGKTDTLIFLSPSEIKTLAEVFKAAGFNPNVVITQPKAEKQAAEIAKLIGKPNFAVDGLDVALFGRMVASAATMNVEAAASFAHAISTHRVTNSVEFFTALDDLQEEIGSAHMGSLEFNSATYYRYISLDIGQLWKNLAGQEIPAAIEAFAKALFVAVPSARQTTQSGASPWEYARVYVRKGQRLQVPFEAPVKAKDNGFLEPSKVALADYLDKKEKLAGSLFGKIGAFTFGDDESYSIDSLIEDIQKAVQEAIANA